MINKYLPLFQFLVEASDEQRKVLVKTLTEQQLHAVNEATYNVLHGVCAIQRKDKKILDEFKTVIRRLVSKELTAKQQRRLLIKHHHILPLILKPVVKVFTVKLSDGMDSTPA
ncbi:hypothetical protein [Solemya elarraichensis gill symbiont]|uniref:Uncharacterized protein n=1 Tax=Solemya elarraichensis gill symbiont TaxID=1918949 RepID=A0A1T2KZ35_9GAMM|nr:hypothetical protein [Solemya elarraichensis gill symbiont]OOZ38117.1 hypothetical protein BOW52_09280 [Solemya elarraichensis gill symbiont]